MRNIIDRPVNPIAANRSLRGNAEPINNQGRMQLRVNTPVNPVIDRGIDQTPKTRTRTTRRLEIGLQFTGGRPDYKKTAYLDAMSYKNTLGDETILDEVIKGYLEGDKTWNEVTKVIASEGVTKSKKKPRERKGPWMKNRRENRNTRKARIYQFTQKAYDQNKKATINKIINGNFSLDNREQVFPEISEVEKVYEKRLEEGNQKDETIVDFPDENLSDLSSLKELKRNTAAGTDGITTPDLRKVPTGHVTAVMSYWWDWRLPPNSEECHTTLLRKKDEELEKVGNWRPITVGNLFIRLYGKLWDKRLRKKHHAR